MVYFEGTLLLKPQDKEEAKWMLRLLSGQKHEVITAVSVCQDSEIPHVIFNPLTDKEIEQYIRTAHPMDKAGSYGIQEVRNLLVSRIKGNFYNVMGLSTSAAQGRN